MKRDVTVCLAYYENPSMLEHQLVAFELMGATARRHLRLVVIDDGSPKYPARIPAGLGFDVSLYRMQVDIPWNQDACRNLAVSQAETDWVLLTDMDHLVPERTLVYAITKALDETCVYTFSRVTAPSLAPYHPHPNSWLLTRAMYDRIGGYDERYAGIYGTDGAFRRGVEREARKTIALKDVLVRVPREHIPDASTTSLERKSDANTEAKKRVDAEIAAAVAEAARPIRGRFPWERVL